MHLQTIFVGFVFTRAAIFVFCSKPKADLTCSTWTVMGHWTDEKDILSSHWSSTSDRTWCSPNTHTQCACTYNTYNSRTLKRAAGGLDLRRQSHFYPKVTISSTCSVSFKWNITCPDSHLTKYKSLHSPRLFRVLSSRPGQIFKAFSGRGSRG